MKVKIAVISIIVIVLVIPIVFAYSCTDSDSSCTGSNIDSNDGTAESVSTTSRTEGWIIYDMTNSSRVDSNESIVNTTIHVNWWRSNNKVNKNCHIDVYDGSSWNNNVWLSSDCASLTQSDGTTYDVDVTDEIGTPTKANALKVRVGGTKNSGGSAEYINVDYIDVTITTGNGTNGTIPNGTSSGNYTDLAVDSCNVDDVSSSSCYNAIVSDGGTTYDLSKGSHLDAQISDLEINTSSPPSEPEIRGMGIPITRNDWFVDNGTDVIKKHDFLNDPTNYGKIVKSTKSSVGAGEWAAAGAASILKDGDTYYIVLRQREPTIAGRYYEIYSYSSGDILNESNWNLVFQEDMTDDTDTIEQASLRKFGSTYYLYFSWHNYGENWCANGKVSYVTSSTISGLQSQLDNPATWTTIIGSGHKDPEVMTYNGNYYMLYGNCTPVHFIMKSSTPTFSSYEILSSPNQVYRDQFSPNKENVGTITYDNSSGNFVYWANAKHGADIYWYWTVSDDLVNWTYRDRVLEFDHNMTTSNTIRYMDYHSLDDQRGLFVLEWDDDKDGIGDLFLWDYSGDSAGDNSTSGGSGSGNQSVVIDAVELHYQVSGTLSGSWEIKGIDGHGGSTLCSKTGEESGSEQEYTLNCPNADTLSEVDNLVVTATNNDDKRAQSLTFDYVYVKVNYSIST